MEDLIKQAFLHVEVIGPHVQEGHYDLIGPDGEIILPVVWEKTVQPGWQISMRMWPENKHPMPGPGQHLSPEQAQRMHVEMLRRRAAAMQGGHGGHHGGHHGPRTQPMRPPGYSGGPPLGGQPPPVPGMRPFPPPGGIGRGAPSGIEVVDVRPKKDKGKKAKKTLSFLSGSKPKKSSREKKLVYTEPLVGYPIH